MENPQHVKRSILYYPTISIPTGPWLRQSLLYWDEISSIVPQSYRGHRALIPYSKDIRYLESVGQFRPISSDKLAGPETQWIASDLENEMRTILQSGRFQKSLPPSNQRNFDSRIHRDKITDAMLDYFLGTMQLARLDQKNDEWIRVESNTALLYMALLAKYLAAVDSEWTIPGTDRPDYENLIYRAMSSTTAIGCLATELNNLLPIPREDTSLADIIEFKQRRREELITFRKRIDEFHDNLGKCQSPSDIKHVAVSFGEELEKGIRDLNSLLHDAKIATTIGAIKALIHPPTMSLLVAMGTAIATKIISIPLEWAISVVGTVATIQVGSYLVDERNKKNKILRDSPFSYVYAATEEGLMTSTEEQEEEINASKNVRPPREAPPTFA